VNIVSMTISNNREKTIGRAIKSVVPHVDKVLLIDTGITDGTIESASEAAGNKLVVVASPWPGRFDEARNVMLDEAAKIGQWGIMLDSDEWITATGTRPFLAAAKAEVILAYDDSGTYTRERIFALPSPAKFHGRTHEAVIGGSRTTFSGMRFYADGKTPEEMVEKRERDLALLLEQIKDEPMDARWRYYAGDSYAGLSKHAEAAAMFLACASLNGWDEESAWACFRAAQSLAEIGAWLPAQDAAARGLARRADFPDLAWMAGWCAHKMGNHHQAVRWSRMAIMLRKQPAEPRIGFRFEPAMFEAPYNVLRYSLAAIGDKRGAEEAERMYKKLLAKRTGGN
jgi:tetratricopeptide (TPR) repeat protein